MVVPFQYLLEFLQALLYRVFLFLVELFEDILFLHNARAIETSQLQRVLLLNLESRAYRFASIADTAGICAAYNSTNRLRQFHTVFLSDFEFAYDVDRCPWRYERDLVHLTRLQFPALHLDNVLLVLMLTGYVHRDTDNVALMPVNVQNLENVQCVTGADMVDDGPVPDFLHVKFLAGAGHEDYLCEL